MKIFIILLVLINNLLATHHRKSHKIDGSNVYRYEPVVLLEEPPIGTLLIDLSAKLGLSLDTSDYKFRFYSPSSTVSNYFLVDQLTGHVKTQRNIDREFLCESKICGPCWSPQGNCSLTIEVVASSPAKQKFVSFDTIIEDKNEFAPVFPRANLILNITENSPNGFLIPLESARDRDSKTTQINYSLIPLNHDPESETIDNAEMSKLTRKLRLQTSPQLSLVIQEAFDYEIEKEFSFKLKASDSGYPALSGYCLITLKITDVNDNLPTFDRMNYEFRTNENTKPDTRLVRVHAEDRDEALNGQVTYSLDSDSIIDELFRIDSQTGWISTRTSLDYEQQQVYSFSVKAQDHGANSMPVYASVTINLDDLNDNSPNISLSVPEEIYAFSEGKMYISEWMSSGAFLAQITVSDLDSGVNGQVKLEIEPSDEYFTLEHLFGNIYSLILKNEIDRERHSLFKIALRASDLGQPSLTSSLVLEIHILDENDNAPKFRQVKYHFSIEEVNQQPLKERAVVNLGRIEADDRDSAENGRLSFEILNKTAAAFPFKINPLTGDLSANQWMLDRESRSCYEFKIVCKDHGKPQLQSEIDVSIKILDINDNEPKILQKSLIFNIHEDLALYTNFGRVSATDADEPNSPNSTLQYLIIDDDNVFVTRIFSLNVDTGDFYLVGKIDYEEHTFYEFQIMVYDLGKPRLASKGNVRVNIIDVNDNAPKIEFPLNHNLPLVLNSSQSDELFTVVATDADSGDNSKLKYEIIKQVKFDDLYEESIGIDFFSINLTSGIVSSKVTYDGVYCLDVQFTDSSRTSPLSSIVKIFLVINPNLTEEISFLKDFFTLNSNANDKRVTNLKYYIQGRSNEMIIDDEFSSHLDLIDNKKSHLSHDFFGKNYKLVLVLIFFASIMMLCITISIFVMIFYRRQKVLILKNQSKLLESSDEQTNLYVNDLNRQRKFIEDYHNEYGKIRSQALMNIDLNLSHNEDPSVKAANSPASSSSNQSSTDASNQTESSILLIKKHEFNDSESIYESGTLRTFKNGSCRLKDDEYARIQQSKIKRSDSNSNKYSTLPLRSADTATSSPNRYTTTTNTSNSTLSINANDANIPTHFFKDENEFKKLIHKQKINCKHVIISEDSTGIIPSNNQCFL